MGLIMRVFALLLLALPVHAQQKYITVASTTSTEQSGLFKHLLPIFERKTGIHVRVVAVGTGQALDIGRRGDADVVFVHAKPLEEKFLAEGHGVKRSDVMYNDFVLVGPKSDPARVAGTKDIVAALQKIKAARAPFVSRGDKSGTHFAELTLWKNAGIDIGKETHWALDETQKEQIVRRAGRATPEITRFKGLGEMMPKVLWDTTLNPRTRRLLRVEIADQLVTDRVINELMGKDASARFRFIMDRAEDAVELDV